MTLVHSLSDPPARPGLTILVTGSTDGIGRATALALARMGHRVLVHGRDPGKGRKALAEVRKVECAHVKAMTLSTARPIRAASGR